jgi:hypothetical protein
MKIALHRVLSALMEGQGLGVAVAVTANLSGFMP